MTDFRKKITLDQALAEILVALNEVDPDVRVTGIEFGMFNPGLPEVGGGTYWTFQTIKAFGNTKSVLERRSESFETRSFRAIEAYAAERARRAEKAQP